MGWLILHPPLPIKGGEEGGESFTFEEPVVSVLKIKLELISIPVFGLGFRKNEIGEYNSMFSPVLQKLKF
jgi:hypothetical protein